MLWRTHFLIFGTEAGNLHGGSGTCVQDQKNIKGVSKLSEYRLEMHDVVKTFPGVRALDGAQLKLRPGTVHALMGENGAGKSTLMKCMFGIYHMDEGEVIYEGEIGRAHV